MKTKYKENTFGYNFYIKAGFVEIDRRISEDHLELTLKYGEKSNKDRI